MAVLGPWMVLARHGTLVPRRILLIASALWGVSGCKRRPPPPVRPRPRAWPVEHDASSAEFEDEIAEFEAEDARTPPRPGEVLFVGSSSIRLWRTLARDFSPHLVKNRGFGGACIRNVIDFGPRMVLPYAPARIVFFAGTNDIHAGATAQRVLADFKLFVAGVHEMLPQTKIAFISITTSPSRFAEVATVREANRLVRDYVATDARLAYIDVFAAMLDESGQPRTELYSEDRLHPSRQGQVLWIPRIEPFLRD
jgi:lysophospholipase L1-like esterase